MLSSKELREIGFENFQIELIEEFHDMVSMPIFEFQTDENSDEYHIYHISYSTDGFEAGGVANIGFMPYGIAVEFEKGYDLQYHLEGLYELCYEDALNKGENNA